MFGIIFSVSATIKFKIIYGLAVLQGFQLVPLKLDCPAHLIKAFLGAAIGKRMWKFLQFTNSASKLDFKIRFL